MVKVASPAPGGDASVATYITVVSECDTNCAAQIGWGQTTNGSGWVWTSNLTTVCIGQDAYTTAFSITPPIGTNYIAARWIHGYLTNYGWRFWGNSNAFSLESTLMLCVTASPAQIIAHPWDFGAATLDGVSLGTGLAVASVGDDLLVVEGISHSAVRDDQRTIGFTLSTVGKIGVTFHVKVKRDSMGPRLVELDYHDGAQWRTYPMLYPLDETGVWYILGGRIPGDAADNRASAQFRIVAYNATASSLDLQSPVITTPVPEPAVMLLVLAIGVFRRR